MRYSDVTGVCLNPSIDRALTIDGFEYGGTNRVLSTVDYAGGKGFNVAVAAAKLGLRSAATGFVFEENGSIIMRLLEEEGIDIQTLQLPGSVRINLKIYDKATQVITELNSKGAKVESDTAERLFDKIDELSKSTGFLVLGGSVAPGLDSDIYARLIETAGKNGCRCILDAEGELLSKGIEARPFMIKPNLHELEILTERRLSGIAEIKSAAKDIVNSGISIVLVSLGKDGALIVTKDEAKHAQGMKVVAKNTVGAGDTMVAGAVRGLAADSGAEEILRQAAAAATCSVMQDGTGLSDISALEDIYKNIHITDI